MNSEIRNKDGKWLNSDVFREAAIYFDKNGYYCPHSKTSLSYKRFWDEELRRCIEGYEVGGQKITGHYYFFLNYCRIMAVDKKKTDEFSAYEEERFPDFRDGDYDYFWNVEIARNGIFGKNSLCTTKEEKEKYLLMNEEEKKQAKEEVLDRLKLFNIPIEKCRDGGWNMIVGKRRRSGFSLKNAAIAVNMYNTIRGASIVFGAYKESYLLPDGVMNMAIGYMNFINEHTAWSKKREYKDLESHKRASFKKRVGDKEIEKGYKSNLYAITFNADFDSARGKNPTLVLFEEAGNWNNLKKSYNATKRGFEKGKYKTGQLILYGTSGNIEGSSADFISMFYDPLAYGAIAYKNKWDEDAIDSLCSYFYPAYWGLESSTDEQGNSLVEQAIADRMEVRNSLKNSIDSHSLLLSDKMEFPLCPSEAFLLSSKNEFPIIELRSQLNKVTLNKLHIKNWQPVYLERNHLGIVTANPDLSGELEPIYDYKQKTDSLNGCVLIKEYPINNPPQGLYKIGFDPYRQDKSDSEQFPSLACIYVYKCFHSFIGVKNSLVASYIGRPYSADDVNRTAEMLAELYNAKIMFENEVTHVKSYFEKVKKLDLLALQPDKVISANVKNSKVARVFGCHMNEQLKQAGITYIKQWLLEKTDVDEFGNSIYNYQNIDDVGLLKELIEFNYKGNFDRISAFIMLMIQLREDSFGKVYNNKENISPITEQLLNLKFNR